MVTCPVCDGAIDVDEEDVDEPVLFLILFFQFVGRFQVQRIRADELEEEDEEEDGFVEDEEEEPEEDWR